MADKDSSLSTDQRVDEFVRTLANILRRLTEENQADLPAGLPTPVKPGVAQEKGSSHDQSK